MASTQLVVEVDGTFGRTDCFAFVSRTFVENQLQRAFFARVPELVVLKVVSPSLSEPLYVGCVTTRPAENKSGAITFSPAFAAASGLVAGEAVSVQPIVNTKTCASVVVEPATVDDSEIIEGNQRRIEDTLLRQLRVVTPSLRIPVPVHQGVTAILLVKSMTVVGESASSDASAGPKFAVLAEGSELHVATKSRLAPDAGAQEKQPQPAMLVAASGNEAGAGFIKVSPSIAEQHHWKAGAAVGILSVKQIAAYFWAESPGNGAERQSAQQQQQPDAERPKLSLLAPGLLRSGVQLKLDIDESLEGTSAVVPNGLLPAGAPLVLVPNPPQQMPAWDSSSQLAGDAAESTAWLPTAEALREVHGGDVVDGLRSQLECLRDAVDPRAAESMVDSVPHHVLVVGGKGSGKSTITRRAAASAGMPFVAVNCAHSQAETSKALRKAVFEAVISAPSVLLLDDIDAFAPADADGRGSSIPDATLGAVTGLLNGFTWGGCPDPFAALRQGDASAASRVIVVATCAAVEGVHDSLRTASTFSRVLNVAQLGTDARGVMLRQLLPHLTATQAHSVAQGNMENYTPFDIKQAASRITSQHTNATPEQVKEVLKGFTPLAHSGIKFLAPQKQSWEDIGGLADARKALHNALIMPSKFPKLFDKLPLKTRSGVLLYGPPGCGKTHLMSVLVSAENLHCIVVNGPEILDKYIGASEQKVRDVFERAQAAAPCVVFFDEFDSVAPQRGKDNTGVTDRVVNQLLCYLDGVEGRKNVFVVAASSRPDIIDAALLRPGRLDKAVHCGFPDREERIAILQSHARKLNLAKEGVDFGAIADETENWTSADLAALVSTAHMKLMQESIDMSAQLATLNIGSSSSKDATSQAGGITADASNETYTIAGGTEESRRAASKKFVDSTAASVLKQMVNSSKAVSSAEKAKVTAKRPELTTELILAAMEHSRPSLSAADVRKYKSMYSRFAADRAPKQGMGARDGVDPADRPVPDSRTTMA